MENEDVGLVPPPRIGDDTPFVDFKPLENITETEHRSEFYSLGLFQKSFVVILNEVKNPEICCQT